jgi:ribonuclease P protein component
VLNRTFSAGFNAMKAEQKTQNIIGRLRKQAVFDRLRSLRSSENRWTAKGLSLQTCEISEVDNLSINVGISVSRKTAKRAVDRNRIKRRLRVIANDIIPYHASQGRHYLITGRTDALTRDVLDLKEDLKWCLRQLKVFQE